MNDAVNHLAGARASRWAIARLRENIREPVSILMCSYNEVEAIETTMATFYEVVLRHLPKGSEFLVEDSGSTDGTREILEDLKKRWPELRVIYKEKREGIPAALKSLVQNARCPWVFMVDSDGQSLATEFWKMAPSMQDADFILGYRTIRHDPLYRRWGSRVFSMFGCLLYGFRLHDINAVGRLCRRDAMAKCAELYGHLSNAFYAETTIWAHTLGFRIAEVEVVFGPRLHGVSHAFPQGTQIQQFTRSLKEIVALYRTTKKYKAARQ